MTVLTLATRCTAPPLPNYLNILHTNGDGRLLLVGLVVGDEPRINNLAGPVGVEVVGHVVALRLHVRAHLVERGGGDEVALTVHLQN